MDRFDDDTLFAELRALRPAPRPEFAAELDERAAAGFPRRESPSAAAMPFALLADRWRAMSPRRRLMPALGFALAALAVATAVVAISQSGSSSDPANEAVLGMVNPPRQSGAQAQETSGGGEPVPAPHDSDSGSLGAADGHGSTGSGPNASSETVYGPSMPSIESAPAEKADGSSEAGGPAGGEEAAEEAGSEEGAAPSLKALAVPDAAGGAVNGPPGAVGRRDIERSAYVVLGTEAGEVAGASAKVYEAVHAANGVVLHSSVQSGSTGATGASFDLLIPSVKLDDALAAFSQIAEVRERHDATNDITAPTVGVTEELTDSNAAIEGLLKELGDIETESERESVEAQLRDERNRHAAIRASLDHLHKRASMSEVSVRIVTSQGAGVSPSGPKSDYDWSVGDALHDAGNILTIAAGVVLVALAILAPIALIALALWLVNRFRVRRLRERTLG